MSASPPRSLDPSGRATGATGLQRNVKMYTIVAAVVIFSLLPLTNAAIEVDSDLVFDDGVEHHHRRSFQANSTSASLTSQGAIGSPDANPRHRRNKPTVPESGLLNSIHKIGKRVKRQLSWFWGTEESKEESKNSITEESPEDNIFNPYTEDEWSSEDDQLSLEEKQETEAEVAGDSNELPSTSTAASEIEHHREKRSTTPEDDDVILPQQKGEDEEDEEQTTDHANLLAAHRHPAEERRGDTSDDEDYFNESPSGLPGSGVGTTTPRRHDVPSYGQPRYFRITFTILEPYDSTFEDHQSTRFRTLARGLAEAVDNLYEDLPGRQSATVIGIRRTDDTFNSLVTLDLGTLDYYDEPVLRDRLHRQIVEYRNLGPYTASENAFSFRAFGDQSAPPPQTCNPYELQCRSGECVPQEKRCDRARDCRDGSDEIGCPTPATPPPPPPQQPPRTTQPKLVTTEEPFTSEPENRTGSIDRCRADDNVRCADGSVYICNVQWCDGTPDCPNGEDEENCPSETECNEGEFMCDLTRCIPGYKRCDQRQDCNDGTDEQGCPPPPPAACGAGEFACTVGTCIDARRRCDGQPDCPDLSDEIDCKPIACEPNEWQCDFGSCIERRLRCNGIADCPHDDSDERNCPCGEDQFTCENKFCIPKSQRCDGINNCQDGSDEKNCQPCKYNEFQCRDRTCILASLRCNRQLDCYDGSDEENCQQPPSCRPDQFRCNDGVCLNINQRCNQIEECLNGEDEKGCPRCTASEFQCRDGTCISISDRCNGQYDCNDGSDEEACGVRCRPDEFRCSDGKKCIEITYRCDTVSDCDDNSDELNCNIPGGVATCAANEFTCGDGTCIPSSLHCDGRSDCADRTDEQDCGPAICRPDEFACSDGTCLEGYKECNGYPECRDGSDEADCGNGKCRSDQFRCNDGVCLAESFRCDGQEDCEDGSDESGCSPRTCSSLQFTCQDGSCIDSSLACNRQYDCRDGSDEVNCPRCSANEFQCGSGECVSQASRCNRRQDCQDGSDESGCPPSTGGFPTPPAGCPPGQVPCRTPGQCVPVSARCDGRYDCQDYSDESNCGNQDGGVNLRTYPDDQIIKENREVVFQCRDEGPLRIPVEWRRGNGLPLPPGSRDVNGRLEMPDIQVEHSGTYICQTKNYPRSPAAQASVHLTVEAYTPLPTRPPTACGINEATCSNGECINKQYVCDDKYDCSDGSDEMRCNPHGCEPNEFRCANKKCVLKTWRCDADDDCGDNSDETNCATNPPGSPCRYHEFACSSGRQCIPRAFQCDQEIDCQDGSDELGCSPVYIQTPPPPMVMANVGDVLTITCTAIGVPVPEVSWRLNWGHVPSKCSQTSVGGVGTLTCPDIQESDQGAYSCEAINSRGSVFAVPDSILVVKKAPSVCPPGYFNEEARSAAECISCFCFGVTTECSSADLFTYQLPPPFDQYRLVGVHVSPSTGNVEVRSEPLFRSSQSTVRPIARNGFQVQSSERLPDNIYPYFALPENYHGNQLKSYGGYLKYTVKYDGVGRPVSAPDVILTGNGYTLVHTGRPPIPGRDSDYSVRIFYGEWYKRGSARPGGDIPGEPSDSLATREEIMMALGDVDNILIRAQYSDSSSLDTSIFNINMDSAAIRNTGQGKAVYVEECRCPQGYTGLSCEMCAPGYNRHRSGPWLGLCSREREPCPPGQYGDPSRNIPCKVCPCPLTNPSNQFGRTCILDTDGDVTCECPQGYVGRRCEQCAAGYQGNPLLPGDSCSQGICDAAGSLSLQPDPSTGQCVCKDHATGPTCNQCKPDTFHLDASNQFGCINCFCMGLTTQCVSSSWYRQQVAVPAFTRGTHDFKLVEAHKPKEPITEGIRVDSESRELVFQDFSRRSPDVYYWLLPPQFLGDKVTSYGGFLNYTVRYVPTPGGQSSRNNAPDVELISLNDIRLLYFGREQIEPNRPQSIGVPLLEQHWQRHDGQTANREHLLMALADLEAVLIKATYTTNTREAALLQVSLDVAEERNTGQSRALPVEQCQCPPGYRGLSCEDCAVGYTRADDGLYLGFCEQCQCNGHSQDCDPETGTCINCADHTTGDQCDECEPGYTGDATQGTRQDCQPTGAERCSCDPRGSVRPDCPDGVQCTCKRNVEGRNCDRCRPGTFSLSEKHIEGCLECFCSGVTDSCQQSNLYRTQIPMNVVDPRQKFTLTDSNRNEAVREGFNINVARNEVGYNFPGGRSQRLFWSLPPDFTGNKITSYGGNLTVTQLYTARPGAERSYDTDVIIVGNGISLYWTNTDNIIPDRTLTYSVPLVESAWRRLAQTGPRMASRADLLTVLADVEAILIRASHSTQTLATYISDVSLDTAVPQYYNQGTATEVELCRCPEGYRGYSCESCDVGYYRDYNDRVGSTLGACVKCPCNGREESCSVSNDGRVTCKCRPGYTGRFCDSVDSGTPSTVAPPPPPPPSPTISVTISEPAIRIVEAGSTVRYRCSGRSLITPLPVLLQWSKEGGELPRDRAIDDRQGLLVITDVRVSDSGTYICSATDGATIATQRAVLTVAGSPSVPPQVTILPRFLEVTEGEPVEFRCEATGNPAPTLTWNIGESKQLNPEAVFSNGVFRIPAARKSDEAAYECRATNPAGTDLQRTILYVREGPPVIEPSAKLTVEPSEYSGPGGDSVRLTCLAGQERTYTMRWSRAGGRELPPNAVQRDGVLTIFNANPADSDIYVCTATSFTGQVDQVQARVTIISSRAPPTVRIEPEIQTISQGTMGELRCIAAGDPTPTIRWSKSGEELGSNIQTSGSLLRIINAMVRDRGIYICTAENPGGQAVASAQIEVERREPPSIQMYPESQQTVVTGGSVLLQCRVVGGIPSPRLRWRRIDGRPLSPLIEELPGGVLRFNQVTLAEAGRYECHAENDAGSVTADANIIVQSLPTISISPSTDVQTVVGRRVRLECRATGEPQPTVTWKKHRTGVAFYDTQPVTADMPQTAVYEITRVTKADEGSYTCVARNAAGAREERLHLTVEDNDIGYPEQPGRGDIPGTASETVVPPRLPPYTPYPNVTSPSSDDVFRIPVGGRAEMRCRVRGNQERIFLNWIRSDNALMPPDHQILEGTLYINNVQLADAGEYSCVGIGPSGSVRFIATARLVVIDPPRIQLNPDRQVVRPGNNAYISCTATGDQPIDIQWSGVGRSLPPSVTVNQGLLQFRGIAISDAGRYVCQARNPSGDAEAVAEVIVSENQWEPIRVSAIEHEVTASEGSRVELRCEVPQSGSGRRPYLTWTLDGAPLPPNAVVRGEVLELNNVRLSNEGRYICEARSGSDTASDHVYLRIDRVTNLALRIDPSQDEIRVGDTVDIRCTATGDTPVSFTWTKVGDRLASNAQVYGGLLRVQDVRPDNGGRYRCTARTPTSSFDEDYILAIQDEPDMNMNMNEMPTVETRTAPYGSTVVMDCRTDLEPPVTFSWSKQGGLLPRDANSREAVLSIPDVRAEDAGTYVCTAQNRKVKMDIPTVLVVTGVVPYFAQAPVSYMALPTLPDAYLQFGIEIAFKPESPNGLILYNGQQKGGGGDFVSLGLNDSYVEFRFDVGSGPAIIRSARPIRTGEWHTVKVKRNRREGTMYVDGEGPFTGHAAGRFQGLDLVEPLYVGGVPSFRDIHRLNGFNRGFVGCISRLVIGSVEHELVRDASISEGVTTCETCAVNPCLNQGICQEATQSHGYTCICPPGFSGVNCDRVGEACFPGACGTGRCVNTEEGFECLCPLGKLGANCEHDIEISEPAFSDGAYVSYPTPRTLRKMRMAMKFNPANAEDGLLMYCAQADDGQGDFTSLAIRDKRLEFRFDSGSGAAVIRSERDINPGEWITVNVSRHFREGELIVNNEPKVTGFSPGQTRGLNLRTPLYIGGFDKQRIRLAPGVEVNRGFTGCISQVEVSNMTLDIVKSVVDASNVQECGSFQGGALSSRSYSSSPCDRNPCLNGGTCRLIDPAQGQYDCSCQDGFRGEHCEIEENLCQALSPCHNGGTCIGTPHAYKCRCPTGYGGTNCEQGADFSSEVSFQGDGYVELSSSFLPHKGSLDEELIIVEFSTTEPNGLIFWHGQTPDIHGKGQDYLALAVVDGILEFSWELGSGPAQIQTAGDARVDDGKRHHVELRRKASDGSIELDKKTEFGESPGLLKTLNTKGNIYIGGLPDFEHMTAGKYKHGFVGCIHSLLIQDPSGIGINFREKALATVNAMACTNDYENDTDNDLWEFDGRVHK